MNREQRIKQIVKSIEDKTGSKCKVLETSTHVSFEWENNLVYFDAKLAKHLLDLLPISEEWISVEERLPEKAGMYLCYCDIINTYDEIEDFMPMLLEFSMNHFIVEDETIEPKHWKPIPPLPSPPQK